MITPSDSAADLNLYRSYLVRLWQSGAQGTWRASVQSVQTGVTQRFANLEALTAFLQTQTAKSALACEQGTDQNDQ